MGRRWSLLLISLSALCGVLLVLVGVTSASAPPVSSLQIPVTPGNPSAGAVPDAPCKTGTGQPALQGEVPLKDRNDGRSTKGYNCNLTLVGQYQGAGAEWVNPVYKNCAYMSAAFPSDLTGSQPGVRVVDASDPAHPKLTEVLTSPAMAGGTWESLRVEPNRGLLAAVASGSSEGVGFFDIYDISKHCAHPVLLDQVASTALSLPANGLGHEGSFSPDGKTYYAAGAGLGELTAIDVSDPSLPKILWTGAVGVSNHGFSFSPDGDYIYIAATDATAQSVESGTKCGICAVSGAGADVYDVSQIQHRDLLPQVSFVGGLHWSDGEATQATIPFTENGHPYLVVFDELGDGAVHILDMADPQYPKVYSQIRLAIEMPANAQTASNDTANDGIFGYQAHYCTLDRLVNPTALACGWFQSGVRVFDIRNLAHPKEIAYFVPPAQTTDTSRLTDSIHGGGTADWCSSPPAFVANELWVTCQDNGFMILRFASGSYPFTSTTATPPKQR